MPARRRARRGFLRKRACVLLVGLLALQCAAQTDARGDLPAVRAPGEGTNAEGARLYAEAMSTLRSSVRSSSLSSGRLSPYLDAVESYGPVGTALRMAEGVKGLLFDTSSSGGRAYDEKGRLGGKGRTKQDASRKAGLEMLEQAAQLGHGEALNALGDIYLWGRFSTPVNVTKAFEAYERLAEQTGNSTAQNMVAFFYSTGYKGAVEPDQGKALLYYTFAALGGDPAAKMAVGFRNLIGIGTPASCTNALSWYEEAADQAYKYFLSGPPGGFTLPYSKTRISDTFGGVFGPGASVASTGENARRPAVKAALGGPGGPDGDSWDDILAFYDFYSARGEVTYTLHLGRIYYQGSVYIPPGGPGGVGEAAGGVERDYEKSRAYFLHIARQVWPLDEGSVKRGGPSGVVANQGSAGDDIVLKVEEDVKKAAAIAASYLGRMYLRGEGVQQDFGRAWVWFQRALGEKDSEAQNGLGIMHREGLGIPVDMFQATNFFFAAAQQEHPDALVNLAKIHLDLGEYQQAGQYLERAVHTGNAFEAYYHLAKLNARMVRSSSRADVCPLAVSFFKVASERGDWRHPIFRDADRAWKKGKKEKALLGYLIAAEKGYESAQNNVAWILDRDKYRLHIPSLDGPRTHEPADDRLALIHWTRSAAQDNVDALVKMGDYYYHGYGTPDGKPELEKAAASYQSAADTHVSALAMWNMGWMYETGLGVPKDYHLAKRYYDMALEINRSEAYLPVTLSLIKLYARALWDSLFTADGDSPSSIFSLPSASKPREEDSRRSEDRWTFFSMADWFGVGPGGVDNRGNDPAVAGAHEPEAYEHENEYRRYRQVRQERARRVAEEAANGGAGFLGQPGEEDAFGLGGDGDLTNEDLIETALILGLAAALAAWVWIRQIAWRRGEREREDEGRQRGGDGGAGPEAPVPL